MDRQYFKSNVSPSDTYHNTVSHTLDIISNKVALTFGPYGNFNLFKNGAEVRASKDGLENLSMIKFDDSIADAVYRMALDVASEQARTVGDGTTSALLVMAEVYTQLRKSDLFSRWTPAMINSAIREIQNVLEEGLTSMALPFDTTTSDDIVEALLSTTLNGDAELVGVLMSLFKTVPNLADKNILLDYSKTNKSFFTTDRGINIMGKLMSPAFGNQADDISILKNVEVIMIDGKVNIMNDILTYVNTLKTQDKSLLIVCSGVNENFYRYIEVMAQTQPKLLSNFCVVYTNALTTMDRDAFNDTKAALGCVYLPENTEISSKKLMDGEYQFGYADNVCIKNNILTIGGCNETEEFHTYVMQLVQKTVDIDTRLTISGISQNERTELETDLIKLRRRINQLSDGVTTVYAGGDTYQNKHITYRAIEDGIKALQAALKHGYFVGCNTVVPNALIQLMIKELELKSSDETSIYFELEKCLLQAYIDVYKTLIRNRARVSDADILEMVVDDASIINADGYLNISPSLAGKNVIYVIDLTSSNKNIINPALTDINIIKRAISAAVVLATAGTIITDRVEFEALI